MFDITHNPDTKSITIELHDKLTQKDYREHLIPELELAISDYGKLNCVLVIPQDFKGWELGAMLEDARFGLNHLGEFGKIALVGNEYWVGTAVNIGRFILRLNVKKFTNLKKAEWWMKLD